MITKKDIIICIIVGLICVGCIVGSFVFSGGGSTVTVSVNSEIVYKASLYKNNEITLKNGTVIIENGYVYMRAAACDNQICVNTGKINKVGQQIVCLPNKILIEVSQ